MNGGQTGRGLTDSRQLRARSGQYIPRPNRMRRFLPGETTYIQRSNRRACLPAVFSVATGCLVKSDLVRGCHAATKKAAHADPRPCEREATSTAVIGRQWRFFPELSKRHEVLRRTSSVIGIDRGLQTLFWVGPGFSGDSSFRRESRPPTLFRKLQTRKQVE